MSLFLQESYNEVQTKFINKIIPDLNENSINLNNFEKFDDLLQFLEINSSAPSAPSSSPTSSCFSNNRNLIYPSNEILQVLITLCSRSNSLNWTQNSSYAKNGIVESLSHIKLINSIYNEFLHKSNLNQRSFLILNNYLDIIELTGDTELYELIFKAINDLIESKKQVQSSHQAQLPFQQQQSSISSMFKAETNGRRTSPRRVTPPPKRQKLEIKYEEDSPNGDSNTSNNEHDSTYIVISDSEDESYEEKIPLSTKTDQESPTSAASSPKKNNLNIFATNNSKNETWEGIRIFDESLLKDKLTINKNEFNLWRLINWTFYCSGLSTIYYPLQKKNECHTIYHAQSNVLNFIFRFIEINLVKEMDSIFLAPNSINNDAILSLFQNTNPQYTKFASLKVEDNSQILFSKLIKTLGHFQSQWYDRVVEFIFNGLSSKLIFPKTCYEHENLLIEKETKYKKSQPVMHNNLKNEWDQNSNNMNSMKLRFKICSIIFYWSLVFNSKLSGSSNGKSIANLNSSVFLDYISKKINFIDYRYLIEFYYSSAINSKIRLDYRNLFLVKLSQEILKEIIGNTSREKEEFQDFELCNHLNNENPNNKNYQIKNLDILMRWINNPILYSQIVEDQLYKTFNEFYQTWMKVNFILEWNLNWILNDLYNSNCNIYKDEIFNKNFQKADHLKKTKFLEFIKNCVEPIEVSGLNFQLNEEDVEVLKGKITKCEQFTSILNYYL
ncbi:hypothetical protein KGF54_003254 [Candida jiufengensis]|uniref:uncharacterized protein n=1 Tax=Candida jiufengensis TaxID=497108 RepID=UPI0022257D06|nr:uncharacterized protein KGF54_003254 [Candida jiufengensis]KAI5952387.1 hypothetical protein KGF54_003254 [Candida jiufengensis]